MPQEKLVLAESAEELQAQLSSLQSELMQMKFDHAVRGLSNPMELRSIRRDVARLQTALRQLEIKAMSPEELAMRSKLRARRRNQK